MSVLDEVLGGGGGFTRAPTEEESASLAAMGRRLLEAERAIEDLETALAERRAERQKLVREEMPAYMQAIGQDRVGLPDSEVDLVLEPYYYANIAADWDPARRRRAFEWLEEHGGGDLIKLNLTYGFRRGEAALARWLRNLVGAFTRLLPGDPVDLPEPTVREEVHHQTLTAWLRERVEAGDEVDLEVLGATVGSVVKVRSRPRARTGKRRS